MSFSLENFEFHAQTRDHEMAARELLSLLQELDNNYGNLNDSFKAVRLNFIAPNDADQNILTRTACAIATLFSDPGFQISPAWMQNFLSMHRWLSALFAATPLVNSDFVLRSMSKNIDKSNIENFEIDISNLAKFCLLYSPESEIPLNLDSIWQVNPNLVASLCMVLVSSRFLGSASAHGKREIILPWLAEKLNHISDIDQLPLGILHDLYMHCSYADIPSKHDIKLSINNLIRKKIDQMNFSEYSDENISSSMEIKQDDTTKPVLLVVLEWFGSSHSIYRTHSKTIDGARKYFHVVGMAYVDCVDEITKQVFDEFVAIDRTQTILDQLKEIRKVAKQKRVKILYMPSVGMFPLTMWLSNIRIASIQAMALGHPATSHSDLIDYVVVEKDYIGDANCFSERLIILPKDGMPYRPSESLKRYAKESDALQNRHGDVVCIAVCSTTMKLNPGFLETCKQITKKSKFKVQFKFLIGQAQGITVPNVRRVLHFYLGDDFQLFPHQDYPDYMKTMSACDLFINPFPFGNTNGIIDTVTAGLIGVCKTGREVHEHIDQGLFERLDWPSWLIANTVEEYINAVIRLVDNPIERRSLALKYSGQDRLDVIFQGRSELLGNKFKQLLDEAV